MLTERERLAREAAVEVFGAGIDQLDGTFQDACYNVADDQLMEAGIELAEKDKEAAKTWGGDIDLVSFEGE